MNACLLRLGEGCVAIKHCLLRHHVAWLLFLYFHHFERYHFEKKTFEVLFYRVFRYISPSLNRYQEMEQE